MRIISLIASATEIICSLGQKNNLVGISHECDYPKDIQNLPVCSLPRFDTSGSSLEVDRDVKSLIQSALSVYRINEDTLKELKPDIIVTQSQCDVCAVSEKDVENAGEMIINKGVKSVLIKGGGIRNLRGRDFFINERGNKKWLHNKFINTKNTHGSGCTLSAAICGYRALGLELVESITKSKTFIEKSLLNSYQIGSGAGPLGHHQQCR